MRFIQTFFLATLTGLLFIACDPSGKEVPLGAYEKGVFILNEGAFGANDGEVYHYDPASNVMQANVFETQNGRPFAGLLQDLVIEGDKIFLVANTGKIEILEEKTFKSIIAFGANFHIPRSLVVANQKLYISDWGPYDANWENPNSFVAVVQNINSGTIQKKINVSSQPEKMMVVGNRLLVACSAAKKLEVIDLNSEEVISSLAIEGSPFSFFEFQGKTYLYAYDDLNVYFHEILTTNFSIVRTIKIAISGATSSLTLGDNGEIFVVTSTGWPTYNDSIVKISLANSSILSSNFYSGSGFYGIGYDAARKEIYLANNNGFQGNGTVLILNPNGQAVKTLNVGRGPSGFVFR
jgi:DNA-binding beta-propeller fold protein YncE